MMQRTQLRALVLQGPAAERHHTWAAAERRGRGRRQVELFQEEPSARGAWADGPASGDLGLLRDRLVKTRLARPWSTR